MPAEIVFHATSFIRSDTTQIGSLSAVIKILNTLSEFNTHDVGDPVGILQQLSTERPADWRCYHIATSTYQQHVMDRQADTTDKWTNSYMYNDATTCR